MKVSNTNSRKKLSASILMVIVFPFLLLAQTSGTLDNTFGSNGSILTPIGTGSDYANTVALQSDGKIVTAGYAVTGTKYDFALCRYNTNGTLDNTFGTGGIVKTSIQAATDQVFAMVIQSDGKIIVGGASSSTANSYDWALARYNSNGTLDNTFGTGGIVVKTITTKQDYIYSIALQSDGKIVCAGNGYNADGTKQKATIGRFNSDGTMDSAFGTNGITQVELSDNTSSFKSVIVLSDGKVVAFGSNTIPASGSVAAQTKFLLTKFNSNGSFDNSFGTSGTTLHAVGTVNDAINSAVLMSDGKFVVAGNTRVGTVNNFVISRFNSNGTIDNSFGTSGSTFTPIGTGTTATATICNTLVYVPTHGFVVGGYGTFSSLSNMVIALFSQTDGKLINSFGTNGIANTNLGTATVGAGIMTMALQKDNKLVVGGFAQGTTNLDAVVARFNLGPTVGVEDKFNELPLSFTLSQNYPNPFNPSTIISYTLPEAGHVSLKVYDAIGKEVITLVNEFKNAGSYNTKFSVSNSSISSGTYFAQLRFNNYSKIIKMLLVK